MGKSNNMAKRGRKITRKGRPDLKPRGSVHSKGGMQTLDACPKIQNHAQVIVHNGDASGHTAVFDTWAQESIIGRYGWEIIKRRDTWIDAQGINIGGSSRAGRHLRLVDSRGMAKIFWLGRATWSSLGKLSSIQIRTRPCWGRTKLSAMVSSYIRVQGSLVVNN